MGDASCRTGLRRQSLEHDAVLRIVQREALAAHRNMSGYRINVWFPPYGWHVDYCLTEPYMAGGGPHYVIDAATGAILSKRYEQ